MGFVTIVVIVAIWGGIYKMDPNETDITRLTNNTTFDGGPSWSP